MSKDDHKIDADDRTVFDVLNERKYTVDYFQREFSWEQKHIEQLVTDLTSTFLDVYAEGDPRTSVEHYNNYYLGPFVVSSRDGMKSIIDGQQRLTSTTTATGSVIWFCCRKARTNPTARCPMPRKSSITSRKTCW